MNILNKLPYLNIGCGTKFHKTWANVDMTSNSPHVKSYNFLIGLPFASDQFDVVYHSQVLEHIPKENSSFFISECFRVIKPGGIMRVVLPDLENIVNEYIKHLNENITNPNSQSEANYDWILLEMYDQTVRNYSGGQMVEFLRRPVLINEKYIIDRIGYMGRAIRNSFLTQDDTSGFLFSFIKVVKKVQRVGISRVVKSIIRRLSSLVSSKEKKIGSFRLGGEVHMWMYDRFSLSRLLREVGFVDIEIKSPFESNIPEWEKYELDVKDGAVFDPTSLFIEARKPR
jgi:predicted SAM-dependent methyltransferase